MKRCPINWRCFCMAASTSWRLPRTTNASPENRPSRFTMTISTGSSSYAVQRIAPDPPEMEAGVRTDGKVTHEPSARSAARLARNERRCWPQPGPRRRQHAAKRTCMHRLSRPYQKHFDVALHDIKRQPPKPDNRKPVRNTRPGPSIQGRLRFVGAGALHAWLVVVQFAMSAVGGDYQKLLTSKA